MPGIRPKVLGSAKRTRQRLNLLRPPHFPIVETLRVKRAVEVVTCVRVPSLNAARQENEKFALGRSSDPQRQPEIVPFTNCYGVRYSPGAIRSFIRPTFGVAEAASLT